MGILQHLRNLRFFYRVDGEYYTSLMEIIELFLHVQRLFQRSQTITEIRVIRWYKLVAFNLRNLYDKPESNIKIYVLCFNT